MSLKVFGSHEQNTLDQIQMSLDSGATKAVLCADGHKGYSVPIGGVVAYPDKISLSAVGLRTFSPSGPLKICEVPRLLAIRVMRRLAAMTQIFCNLFLTMKPA